jgi:hypothetical protein
LFVLSSFAATHSGQIIDRWFFITGHYAPDLHAHAAYPYSPDSRNLFDGQYYMPPRGLTYHFGQRIYGRFLAPQTGNYRFWLSSDDGGELWLGTNATEASKRMIAAVKGNDYYNSSNQWTRYKSQKSEVIVLTAGQFYWIETVVMEGAHCCLLCCHFTT